MEGPEEGPSVASVSLVLRFGAYVFSLYATNLLDRIARLERTDTLLEASGALARFYTRYARSVFVSRSDTG